MFLNHALNLKFARKTTFSTSIIICLLFSNAIRFFRERCLLRLTGQADHVSEVNPNACGRSGARNVGCVSQSGKLGIQTDSGISTQVYRHEYPGHPDDYFSKFRPRRRPSVLASPRAPDMWSNLPDVTKDACGVFVQRFPKELIVRRSAYLSVFHHHLRRVVALAPFIFFPPCRSRLP